MSYTNSIRKNKNIWSFVDSSEWSYMREKAVTIHGAKVKGSDIIIISPEEIVFQYQTRQFYFKSIEHMIENLKEKLTDKTDNTKPEIEVTFSD